MRKQCLSCGIQAVRVSAVKASPGWHGCGLSHKKVAELAKANNDSWYLVLEDDALFSINDWNRFMKVVPYLWEHRADWDILNGGVGSVDHFKLIERDPIIYEVAGYCSHFYFVNSSAFDKMAAWTTESQALDNYAKSFRMIGTYPFIATQSESPSDLSDTNGPGHIIRQSEAVIRDMLRNDKVIEGLQARIRPNNNAIVLSATPFIYKVFDFFRGIY
jgi:hypothetical protein